MNRITEKSIKEVEKILSDSQKICLLTHKNPDGDAIGSMLALYWYLIKKKHNVSAIVPNDFPDFLRWLPGSDNIICFEKKEKSATTLIKEADLIFCLDFNDPDRINEMGVMVKESLAMKILIDHHPDPADFTKHIFSDTSFSSTAELLYTILKRMEGNSLNDLQIAECIYTGIMTDTGSFSYNSSEANTYSVVSELITVGIDKDKIHSNVFDNFSEDRMKLLGYCLNEKMVVLDKYHTAYISLSMEELKSYKYSAGDSEGFVNYPLSIKGIKVSAIFIEFPDHIKISFRSKGEFPVNKFSSENFSGGGHKNAAGGKCQLSLEETIRKFVNLLPEYSKELR